MMESSGQAGLTMGVHEDAASMANAAVWPIHEDYRVEHGQLVPMGEVALPYDVFAYPGIVTELGKLHEGDEKQLVEFARTWGLLGSEEATQSYRGDHLPWVWDHVRNARLVLDLHHYLQQGDHKGLGQFLDSYRTRDESGVAGPVVVTIRVPWDELRQGFRGEEPTKVAEEIMTSIINYNLEMLHHKVYSAPLRLAPHCPSALIAVYWHLAKSVTSGRVLIRCEECGALFLQTDKRQRFCPPPPEWAGKTGSPCGARQRQRRQRQRTEPLATPARISKRCKKS